MKFRAILDKAKGIVAKIGTKTLIAICGAVVLGGVVLLGILINPGDDGKIGDKLAVDLTQDGAGDDLQPDEVSDYFATIALQRKQARDEAMEVLSAVISSSTALDEVKQEALNDMNEIAANMEAEANIETLVQSKGFEQCVAVISDGKCSVIVESEGLLVGEIAQISEIVYQQAGIVPQNLTIIEKNTKT